MSRRYTAEERAEAIALSLAVGPVEAARQLGMPPTSVASMRRRAVEAGDPVVLATREAVTERLREVVSAGADEMLRRVRDPKTPANAVAQIVDVASRNLALMTGGVTERTESTSVSVSVTPAELDAHRRTIADAIAASLAREEADDVA